VSVSFVAAETFFLTTRIGVAALYLGIYVYISVETGDGEGIFSTGNVTGCSRERGEMNGVRKGIHVRHRSNDRLITRCPYKKMSLLSVLFDHLYFVLFAIDEDEHIFQALRSGSHQYAPVLHVPIVFLFSYENA